ncbi:hypothetical protein [Oceanobacillus sp. J11TS1]|uniref:hypothetical protein n=1 Tax=Oceanobacillus sp. J11TS1 TaxID=2807191 RepID=UPI001B1C635F|nr:hypothetical protein [Oceanobacillus sp. J11TS1]GIO21951.1 hypothetical protein J11TS1_05320 [Oceanobacillus sp. J11TS1]
MRIQENIAVGKLSQSSKAGLLRNMKSGDILQGTVKQLYPNHKAVIHMQGNQLIAQLEASLSVGGKYFFQVTSNEGKMPKLQVLTGEQQNGNHMVSNLLQQLGIKESKLSSQIVNSLVKEQVPIQQPQLMQVIRYLQDNKMSFQQAQPIVMQLMKSRIPVTDATFQALQAFQNGSLSENLQALERSLLPNQQPIIRAELEHVLRGFPSQESAVRAMLIADVQQAKPMLFPLLQNLGFISKAMDKQAWAKILQQWNPSSSQTQGTINPPFTTSFEGLKDQLQPILTNHKRWMSEANALHGMDTPQSNSSKMQTSLEAHFSNNPQVMQGYKEQDRHLVEPLMEPKNYQALERLIKIWTASGENIINNPKEQFLQQLRWVLHDAGIHAESALKTEGANGMHFKHLLLEMIQASSGGSGKENAQQVVHFLNGMQLNNMHDSNYFIQANIQLPSQKFGLSKDIHLQFEGKKTRDGKIDPECCRIIFDLELQRMKETIVDLHVQRKALAITIYNDQATTPAVVDKLRPSLQEALLKLNYELTTIVCKPFTEVDKQQFVKPSDEKANYRKVDFRV